MKSREVTPAAEEPLPLSHPTNQAVASESVTDQLSQRTARLRLEVRAAEEALLERRVVELQGAELLVRLARQRDPAQDGIERLLGLARELGAERGLRGRHACAVVTTVLRLCVWGRIVTGSPATHGCRASR